jgi:hypothetical protein
VLVEALLTADAELEGRGGNFPAEPEQRVLERAATGTLTDEDLTDALEDELIGRGGAGVVFSERAEFGCETTGPSAVIESTLGARLLADRLLLQLISPLLCSLASLAAASRSIALISGTIDGMLAAALAGRCFVASSVEAVAFVGLGVLSFLEPEEVGLAAASVCVCFCGVAEAALAGLNALMGADGGAVLA